MTGRYLNRRDLIAAGALDWDAALADVHDALALLRAGKAEMAAENVLPLGTDPRARGYGLPARVGGRFAAAGLKWAVHRPEAPQGGEAITSCTILDDLETGLPMGIVDSAMLTRVRTAALSGSVVRALKPGVRRIAILGAGAQAQMHLRMARAVFPDLAEVHHWTRSGHAIEAPEGIEIRRHRTASEASLAAEVTFACTSAPEPILGPEVMARGALILQIGYHEVSFEAIDRADAVTCDLWGDFARTSAKSLFQMHRAGRFPADRIAADAAAILLDGWRPDPAACVYFSSFGLNIFDIALAARLMRRATDLGLGQILTD
ncbi:ornithine cyclodeaminase [Mameliella alba]|uniref:ornithine cyclodeaminase n=1 Tax=Mameliella alba TaxID=561184 RepID=UPI0014303CC0|nr:ornithine cyclodeaminase [Mameliella alba]